MPTEPIDEFLKRDLNKDEKELFQILEKFASGIEETVNYGTVIFKWSNASLKGKNDKNIPTLLLFRHSLELCDAISILVKNSAIDPCKTHLRALFEALLSILYLLEQDQEKRAFAFLVCRAHHKIRVHKNFKPDTEVGKQFKGKMKKTVLNDISLPKEFDVDEAIKNQEELLRKDGYKEANEEYLRLKKKKKKTPNWYEFYDGPQSIEQMAGNLGKIAEYEMYYRNWSEYMHSTDVIAGNLIGSEGKTYITSLRQPFEAQFITFATLTFTVELYRKAINHFVPNNITHYRIWYLENIRDLYKAVSSQKRIINKV